MRISRRRAVVACWAAVTTAIFVGGMSFAPSPSLQSSRIAEVSSAADVLSHGGPPLVVSDVPYRPRLATSHLLPAGITDDQGIYLYLPLLADWTGVHDPARLLKWLFIGCWAIAVFALPFIVEAIFASLAAAAVTPLLIDWIVLHVYKDVYWVQAWVAVLGIPLLVLAYRWWVAGRRRAAATITAPLLLAAGFATSIRAHAGTPIAISAVGVVVLAGGGLRARTGRDWLSRAGVAALLLAAYACVGLAFLGVRAYRDSRVHFAAQPIQLTSHPFWHPAYLGLGYLPNRFGIAWNDSVAADAVGRAAPGTPYLSARYEQTLRHLYFHFVESHPTYALRDYVAKLRVAVADALRRYWLLVLLVPVAVATRRTRGVKIAFWIALPALLAGLASPVLAVPLRGYEIAFEGAVAAAWLLAVAWAAARVASLGPRRVVAAARGPFQRGRTLILAAVLFAVGAAAAAARPNVPSDDALYRANATPLVPPTSVHGTTVARWSFPGRLPHGWRLLSTAQLQADYGESAERGTHLTTTTASTAQLEVRTARLASGTYDLVAHVRVLAGGLTVDIADPGGHSLATGRYWWQGGNYVTDVAATRFHISTPTRTVVSLANWTTVDAAASWVIWDVRVVRVAGKR
jgi:hypothetical protein